MASQQLQIFPRPPFSKEGILYLMAVSHRSCRNKAETSELTMIVKLRKQYEKYPDLTPDQQYRN